MSDQNIEIEPSPPGPLAGLMSSPDDDSLVDSGTALAPSCPDPIATAFGDVKPFSLDDLSPGARIDDFEIISPLGRGAFGTVYLARQLSLDRQVALKITAWQGGEGRKMARLEHENIVQVFSETAYGRDARLLCMQYVAGATLQDVLDELTSVAPADRSGQKLLEVVDRLVARPADFDPAALRNRELLSRLDWPETVCWIGARLAEALDFAHSRGVLHRDIKPGNIMVNQYGRPLLVDFNLAYQPLDASGAGDRLGGTLAYMAPEHLEAFAKGSVPSSAAHPEQPPENRGAMETLSATLAAPPSVRKEGQATVAQAADIYSLGVVLYQMASGRLPFTETPPGKTKSEVLQAMAAQRRELPPPLPSELPQALDQVVARCLHPNPAQRFAVARELSAALEGCRNYLSAEKAMPDFHGMRATVMRHPMVWLLVLSLSPHLVASVINIVYNYSRIITKLDDVQQAVFVRIIYTYDPLGYAVGIALALRVLWPVARAWLNVSARLPGDCPNFRRRDGTSSSALRGRENGTVNFSALETRNQIDDARRIAITWPLWAGGIACLCWVPGGIVFPTVLTIASQPLPLEHWVHLIISFTLSGLIAATYSMYFVQWIALCVVYPRLWYDRQGFRATAAAELRGVPKNLWALQIMAGLIPSIAAVLMVWSFGKDQSFQLLTIGLILLGSAGFPLATYMSQLLSKAHAALTGASDGGLQRGERWSP